MDTGDWFNGLESINFPLAGTLILAWVLIFWSQSKGTESTGKLSWVTSLLPYICLTALFIGTITLPGATSVGIKKYAEVNVTYLATGQVWRAAAQQVFFSQGAAWGVLINFAAHNKYRMNVYTHSWRLSIINAITSFYGGFTVFATLGFLALSENNNNIELAIENFDNVVQQKQKLAFVVYPVAISQMPVPMFWACLFFLMLTTLGVGSQVGMFMCLYEGIRDKFQTLRNNPKKFLGALVLLSFILAYPMMTRAGIQWLNVFDWSVCALSIFIFGFLETIAVSYYFGIDKFMEDIEGMLRFELPMRKVWRFAWSVITPLFCFVLIVFNIYDLANNYLCIGGTSIVNGVKKANWSPGVNAVGWLIQMIQILPIFYFAATKWRQPMDPRHYDNKHRQLRAEDRLIF